MAVGIRIQTQTVVCRIAYINTDFLSSLDNCRDIEGKLAMEHRNEAFIIGFLASDNPDES